MTWSLYQERLWNQPEIHETLNLRKILKTPILYHTDGGKDKETQSGSRIPGSRRSTQFKVVIGYFKLFNDFNVKTFLKNNFQKIEKIKSILITVFVFEMRCIQSFRSSVNKCSPYQGSVSVRGCGRPLSAIADESVAALAQSISTLLKSKNSKAKTRKQNSQAKLKSFAQKPSPGVVIIAYHSFAQAIFLPVKWIPVANHVCISIFFSRKLQNSNSNIISTDSAFNNAY